jgi:hypothetical protein
MVARARARTRAGTRLAAARTEQVVEEVLLGPNNAGRLVRRRVGEAGRGARRAANQPVPAQREEWRQKRGRGGGAQAARMRALARRSITTARRRGGGGGTHRLGPCLWPSAGFTVWHCAHLVLKILAPCVAGKQARGARGKEWEKKGARRPRRRAAMTRAKPARQEARRRRPRAAHGQHAYLRSVCHFPYAKLCANETRLPSSACLRGRRKERPERARAARAARAQ